MTERRPGTTPPAPSGSEPDKLAKMRSVEDAFAADLGWGDVIGSRTRGGDRRGGVDAERALSTRGGVLVIRPLVRAGWGRAGLTHGPFERQGGLALAVHVLAAHHASETYHLGSLLGRLARWATGSRTVPLWLRLCRWPFRWRRGDEARRLRQWQLSTRRDRMAIVPEGNLAVGWFSQAGPSDPLDGGTSFLVRPAGPKNGTLTARVGGAQLETLSDLRNVPLHYVTVLREQGAAYYLASIPGTRGAAAHPFMRPLAIDPTDVHSPLYAGVQQSVLGEMGFSADTLVYGMRVAHVPELAGWCGSAHVADRLRGTGPLSNSTAERGGVWSCPRGAFQRGPHGASPMDPLSCGLLFGDQPAGLLKVTIRAPARLGQTSVIWRAVCSRNFWRLSIEPDACSLALRVDDDERIISKVPAQRGKPNDGLAVQIVDDGARFSASVNGCLVTPETVDDPTFGTGCGVGIAVSGIDDSQAWFCDFEAHPRRVPIPKAIRLPAASWRSGTRPVLDEHFTTARADLEGQRAGDGRTWTRLTGPGSFAVEPPDGLRVVADVAHPLAARTAYGIAWSEPGFADLSATVLPPGTARGQNQRCRAGLIFWQDARNYIIVNTWLDDIYQGASISSFYCLNGFEDIFDAYWTNVGDRIVWGQPFELRVHFDGDRFGALVDGEPVLQRALSEIYPGVPCLRIHAVGVVANWEWGHDTGSRFRTFTALA